MQTFFPVPADCAPPAPVERALLEDGSLALRAQPEVWNTVALWMPRIPERAPVAGEVRAWIDAEAGAPSFPEPEEAAAFVTGGVNGWIQASGRVLLRERAGRVSAVIHPADQRATVRLMLAEDGELPRVEIMAVFSAASALLLGRLGRVLVHAAAFEAPDGRAWMLAGGSFSGKSTTCITLIRGGWNYLADDHVILGRGADGELRVEGWPRRFNLDDGYERGASAGVRSRVDPAAFGPGRWVRSAALAGLLFPRVEAGRPTALHPVRPADALARMLGQSAWMLADQGSSAAAMGLLGQAAGTAAYDLRLGSDCYRNSAALQQVVAAVCGPAPA